jgi:phage terminase Nu1 subunit (DNA packaging protein)
MIKRKSPVFPRLNETEMAAFLAIQRVRMQWARREGIVERGGDGLYDLPIATAQWLKYERSRSAKGQRRSEIERQRARFIKAKADAAELRLATLNYSLVSPADIIERVKTVCLRIRNKLLTSTPRIARACYSSPSVGEATLVARREVDVLLAELAALEDGGPTTEFEVVQDADDKSRPSAG